MWFKNLIFYRLNAGTEYPLSQLEDAFAEHTFQPCASQELSRYGWIAPHPALDSPIFASQGAWLICAQKEEKIIPAAVVKRRLNERIAEIEQQQSRKVYRKEQLQLKDEIILDLLPRAFSRYQQTHALLLPRAGFILVDSATHKRAEELLNLLRQSLTTLPVVLPDVQHSPAAVMTQWLLQTRTEPAFQCLDECELKDLHSEGGSVRIKGQDLFSSEISAHLEADKQVTKLAVSWDDSLTFILQDDLSLKRIRPTDQLSDSLNDADSDDPLARLDSDVARLALEYQRLLPQLLTVFGGEQSPLST